MNCSCLVFGTGRSGTSLVMGLLKDSGYLLEPAFYPGRDTNPKGFFEGPLINGINEDILYDNIRKPNLIQKIFKNKRMMKKSQTWLAQIPLEQSFEISQDHISRMTDVCTKQPFLFKDPRFSYTLPLWKPYLGETKFVVVFRHPENTIQSILKEVAQETYLHSLRFGRKEAESLWLLMYSHILKNMEMFNPNQFLFVHYDQILDLSAVEKIESFLEVKVDQSFIDTTLYRNRKKAPINSEMLLLYMKLCNLASYHESE